MKFDEYICFCFFTLDFKIKLYTQVFNLTEAFKECKQIKEMIGTLITNYKDDSLVENTLQRFTGKTGSICMLSNNNVDS
jgi:hypothetical protein